MKNKRISASTERHANALAFRGLISEIKILSYVEDHPNIIKLEGAYTSKLRKASAIVFLEFCSMGSLDKHLRTYKPEEFERSRLTEVIVETSLNEISADECNLNGGIRENVLPTEIKNDLVRWSQEIVSGMQYLTEKKLVHADLATRNILLDTSKTAKISDFGLSRRLYSYSEYAKQGQASLPWRWMAPESLRKLIFNEKTDVWAFGVTLWEMYTLGDLPYPGLSYHINFPSMLTMPPEIGGVRLAKPKYSTNEMYEMMKQCWETVPGDRPSFVHLQAIFANID